MNGSASAPSSATMNGTFSAISPATNATSRQSIELGHYDRAALGATNGQRCGELRPPVERISSFARFDLDEFGDELELFGRCEAGNGFTLGFDAEP